MDAVDLEILLKRVFMFYSQQFSEATRPNLLPLLAKVRGEDNKQRRYNLYRSLAKACDFSARTPYPAYMIYNVRRVLCTAFASRLQFCWQRALGIPREALTASFRWDKRPQMYEPGSIKRYKLHVTHRLYH